jgi:hypothetical protein
MYEIDYLRIEGYGILEDATYSHHAKDIVSGVLGIASGDGSKLAIKSFYSRYIPFGQT